MSFHRLLSVRGVALIIGALLVSVAAYGFAASNTVPETGAGDGADTISGYAVSAVTYALEDGDTDPTTIDKVSFTLDDIGTAGLPADVQVQIVSVTGSWYDCTTVDVTLPAGYVCAVSPSVDVSTADQLRVVAAE